MSSTSQPHVPQNPVPTLNAAQLAQKLGAQPAPVLIDVREDWEFKQGAIAGAMHVPLAQLVESTPASLGLSTDTVIVAYCHHGVRSQKAGQALRQVGYTDVWSLDGGIDAWSLEVDSRVGRY